MCEPKRRPRPWTAVGPKVRDTLWTGLLLAVVVGIVAGCGVQPPMPFEPNGNDGNKDNTTTEPNDTFGQGVVVDLGPDESTSFEGMISRSSDIDVFNLGPASAGDWVTVFVDAVGSGLDPAIALFDGQGRLLIENDDVDLGIDLSSLVDEALRRSVNPLFLVITSSQFGSTSGNYEAMVEIERGDDVPFPEGQILILNFAGGFPGVPDLPELSGFIPAFDAKSIDPVYRGKDDVILEAIIDTVKQNFARYDVEILVRKPWEEPMSGVVHSTVFIGGFSNDLFGIAEDVDVFNSFPADVAVVFSGSFTPNMFPQTPSAANLGLAIGNIAAHEAGHLLGLNHVANSLALMDTGSPPSSFLLNQEFKEAQLHASIFPIGTQDAHLLLLETVGWAEGDKFDQFKWRVAPLARTLGQAAEGKAGPITAGREVFTPEALKMDTTSDSSMITKADLGFCFCSRCVKTRIKTAAFRVYYDR